MFDRVKRNVPGQQVVDAVDRVVSDALQDMCQISLRVQTVEFRRTDQAINSRRSFTASIRADELIILATQSDGAQRPLCRVVVDFDAAVIAIARQRLPPIERIKDCTAQCRFFRHLSQRLVEPGL